MPQLFNYKGFGLNISSEIEFPELLESPVENTDLLIRYGTLQKTLLREMI